MDDLGVKRTSRRAQGGRVRRLKAHVTAEAPVSGQAGWVDENACALPSHAHFEEQSAIDVADAEHPNEFL